MARPKKINDLEPSVNSEVQDSLEVKESFVNPEGTNMNFVEVNLNTKIQSFANPKDVVFIVEYPKDYKGNKNIPEGEVIISKESAEIFISKRIGKIK